MKDTHLKMKNVVLLGSTGSIGTSTIKVAEDLPDRIRLLGLAAGNNAELLLDQTRKHRPEAISISDPAKARELRDTLGTSTEVFSGAEGLIKLATLPGADIVLIAIVGTAGLEPALAAIRAGKDIAIASKEILVMAGEIVMREARDARRERAGGGQRALGDLSVSGWQTRRVGAPALADGLRRPFSHDAQRGICCASPSSAP